MVAKGTVIVTGASGGLGRVVSRVLAERGYDVWAQYRSLLPDIDAAELGPNSGRYCVDKADLTDPLQARAVIENAIQATNVAAPWAIVNLAGGCLNGMSWKLGADDFANVLEQNVITTHNVCRAAIPFMRNAARGRIVNVTSVVGQTGLAGAAAYSAAKAAVIGYTKSLALELAPKGITCNAIAAGYFSAGMIRAVNDATRSGVIDRIPLNRLGEPHELADFVFALLDESAGYITGQVLGINGGLF